MNYSDYGEERKMTVLNRIKDVELQEAVEETTKGKGEVMEKSHGKEEESNGAWRRLRNRGGG